MSILWADEFCSWSVCVVVCVAQIKDAVIWYFGRRDLWMGAGFLLIHQDVRGHKIIKQAKPS